MGERSGILLQGKEHLTDIDEVLRIAKAFYETGSYVSLQTGARAAKPER